MSCFSILTSVLQDNFKFGPGSGCQVRVFPSRPGRRPGWAAFRGVAQFDFVYSAGDTAQGVKRGPSVTPSISPSTPSSQSGWARGSGRSSSSGQVARSECNPTRVGLGGRLGWSSLSGVARFFFVYSVGYMAQGVKRGPSVCLRSACQRRRHIRKLSPPGSR